MKKVIAGAMLAACSVFAAPQLNLPNNVTELNVMANIAEKKALVLANMNIQDKKQLEDFGKLYDEYQIKLFDIAVQQDEAILFYAKNYNTLTDMQAKDIIAKWNKIRESSAALKSEYSAKFEKILPATVALRYLQIESKLNALNDVRAAELIPLAKQAEAAKK